MELIALGYIANGAYRFEMSCEAAAKRKSEIAKMTDT